MTPRPDDIITESNADIKPERPKPPTSLLTDTLQAIPPKQIPIVSPDRSLYLPSFNKKYMDYPHVFIHGISCCLCYPSVVHRQTERRTQTMILCLRKPLSQRAPCCRSSADQKLQTKKKHTPSILYTVSRV